MKKNIFLKSVLRQPIRTFILTILISAAAFAFVARATEFFVVRDEITRIEALYRSVGILSPTQFSNFTIDHDVTRALEVIEGNRHVAISDGRNFTQGVMADTINIATHPAGRREPYFNPALHGVDIRMAEHFFIGQIRTAPRIIPFSNPPVLTFLASIQELILGDPSIMRVGDRVFTNEQGQTVTILGNENIRLTLTESELELFEQELWHPLDGLDVGDYALFRASPKYVPPDDAWVRGLIYWYMRPLVGTDGLQHIWVERDMGPDMYWLRPGVSERSQPSDFVFFANATEGTDLEDMLYYLQDELEMIAQNFSSVTVIDTKDMTAMPRFTDPRVARLLGAPDAPMGRWLTYEDYLYGNPVVVIPAPLAARRNIGLGDSLTITLRDNPRPTWIDAPTVSIWSRGIENWWDNSAANWWGMIDAAHENWRDFPTHELTLEVVGIYWFFPPVSHNFTSTEIFIPAGLIPEGFGWDDAPLLTGMYSFVLDSPRLEEAFLRETRAELYSLGFTAMFLPNGFDILAAATDPIRFSISINLAVFGAASALILVFIVLLYLRQWRKSVAITQALGTPRKKVLGQLFTPTLFLWVPSIIIGGLIGWFFAINQAEATLETLATYDTAVMPAIYLLFFLCGLLIACILAGVLIGGYGVIRRPVLTQLQGGTQKRRKSDHIDSGVVPEGFALGNFELAPLPATNRLFVTFRANLRHSVRLIFRTPVKTTLALLLALMFAFSLGWLNNTIHTTEEEAARLWETTIIEAEIIRGYDDGEQAEFFLSDLISYDTWNVVEFSGFLGDAYLESISAFAWGTDDVYFGVSHLDGLIAENTKTLIDEQLGVICAEMEIEFFDGFGPEDFAFVPGEFIPLIIRRGMYTADIHWWLHEWAEEREELFWWMSGLQDEPQEMRVIGIFDGGLQRAVNRLGEDNLLYVMPLEAHQLMFTGQYVQLFNEVRWIGSGIYDPSLATARFTIDPARNREIDAFRELMQPVLLNNDLGLLGPVPLLMHIDDDVIYNVIIPMEQNLSLLRVLYPIAIGVAFVLALGLSLLTMLQSAKNAAIMRVLGKPRLASQVMLCTEQLIVCVTGIILGLMALLITGTFMGIAPLYLAGVYFGGAVIGSVIGALIISMRAPLNLLQVRE